MEKITLICPIHNEEKNIKIFVETFLKIFDKFKEIEFSILFADNNSTDNSYEIIKLMCEKNKKIKYLGYSKNYGVMKSIYTAIHHVNDDACAVFDCDLQDPADLLTQFILEWRKGFKIIYGKRIKREESLIIKILRNIFKKLNYLLKGFNIEVESGAWFLDKRAIDEIKNSIFDPYLPALINNLDFKKKPIMYERKKRKFGKSKFNFFRYLNYAVDGFISGTSQPLRISIFFSFIFGVISLFSAVYFLIAKFIMNIPFAEGIAAIIIINLFSFSLIFFFISIIGEYIGKIYLSENNKMKAKVYKKINF
tara:strand:+ start:555 stop:1478 length:924 start_codon:yes stop_codon:yes gene_type:complete